MGPAQLEPVLWLRSLTSTAPGSLCKSGTLQDKSDSEGRQLFNQAFGLLLFIPISSCSMAPMYYRGAAAAILVTVSFSCEASLDILVIPLTKGRKEIGDIGWLLGQVMDCCSRDSFGKVRSWVTGACPLLRSYIASMRGESASGCCDEDQTARAELRAKDAATALSGGSLLCILCGKRRGARGDVAGGRRRAQEQRGERRR